MGFFSGLGRCVVTCLNLFFVVISLLLIIIGVFAFYASSFDVIKTIESKIKSSLNDIASGVSASKDGIDSFSISEFLDGLGMALIIAGCVLLGLSFFGCCGACYKFRTLIFIYAIIISVLLLGEVLVVVLMYAAPDTIQGNIKNVLMESLKGYKGIGNSDVTTLGWMFVMQEMECCGVTGYKDFNKTTTDDWREPGTATYQVDAPIVCCVKMPSSNSDLNCAKEATLNIHTKGCFDVVWGTVLGNPVWAGVGYSVAFVSQLLLIIFAISVYRELGEKNRRKVAPKL